MDDASWTPSVRRPVSHHDTVQANRSWWDREAAAYQEEHGAFLGDAVLVWGPEGWTEAELGLLGEVAGRDVLEIGCGGAQGSRYVARQGARVVGLDLSSGMLAQARGIDARIRAAQRRTPAGDTPQDEDSAREAPDPEDGPDVPLLSRRPQPVLPLLQADACHLPLADGCVDIVFTAYGVLPFVADSAALLAECARVLRPGGLLVASTTHPFRWAFPDVPGPAGLTVSQSYFDRTPYVEGSGDVPTYVEHHRTLGDWVRDIVGAGLELRDLVEPEWPNRNSEEWGGWSPLRGAVIPGTVILVARRPASPGR